MKLHSFEIRKNSFGDCYTGTITLQGDDKNQTLQVRFTDERVKKFVDDCKWQLVNLSMVEGREMLDYKDPMVSKEPSTATVPDSVENIDTQVF